MSIFPRRFFGVSVFVLTSALAAEAGATPHDLPSVEVSKQNPSAVQVCPPLDATQNDGYRLSIIGIDAMDPDASKVLVSKHHAGAASIWVKQSSDKVQFVAVSPAGLVDKSTSWVVCTGRFLAKGKGRTAAAAGGQVAGPGWLVQVVDGEDKKKAFVMVNFYDSTQLPGDVTQGGAGLTDNDTFALVARSIYLDIASKGSPFIVPYFGYCGAKNISPNVAALMPPGKLSPVDAYGKTGVFLAAQGLKNGELTYICSVGHGANKFQGQNISWIASGKPAAPGYEQMNMRTWGDQLRPYMRSDSLVLLAHCHSARLDGQGTSPAHQLKTVFSHPINVADPAVQVSTVGLDGVGIVSKPEGTVDGFIGTPPGVDWVAP